MRLVFVSGLCVIQDWGSLGVNENVDGVDIVDKVDGQGPKRR